MASDSDKSENPYARYYDDGNFQGWKKTSLLILKDKSLKKKKLLKKLWKVYKSSDTYKELSLDQQTGDYKSINSVVSTILKKENKKFEIQGDIEDNKCKI